MKAAAGFKARRKREEEKMAMWHHTCQVAEPFDKDPDLVQMCRNITVYFGPNFGAGYKCYEEGSWQRAKELLTDANRLGYLGEGVDGPSETLIRHMCATFFVAPEKWQGFREFTEK